MGSAFRLAVGIAFAAALANASVTYTCDATINSLEGSGVCAYLNSTVAGYYNSTFTNANINIYLTTSSSGLGESIQVTQGVSYATYYNALSTTSTDATALASLPSTEPAIFGGGDVGLTSALASALGIPGTDTAYGALIGVTAGSGGTDPSGIASCVMGTTGCYNGLMEIVTPAGLSTETSGTQGLWYRGVAGTASGPQPGNDYDFFSVVEHETDELLGSASCSNIVAGPAASNGCTYSGLATPGPSAVDLFRYSAPGTRVFNSLTPAYFSPNGGVTDTDGNTYNTTAVGEDYADFHQSCLFIQDAEGCPGQSVNITNDNGGGPGPEIAILNAVGFNLESATPEPATFGLLGASLLALGFAGARRRNKK